MSERESERVSEHERDAHLSVLLQLFLDEQRHPQCFFGQPPLPSPPSSSTYPSDNPQRHSQSRMNSIHMDVSFFKTKKKD